VVTVQRALQRFHSGILLRLLAYCAVFSLAAVPPLDPDLWWHLANGRLLVALSGWPHGDVYSFSAQGNPWVMHEWLADLGVYGLFRLGGLPLLVAIFALMVAATAWLLHRILGSAGLHPTAAVALTVAGMLAGSTTWGARPQLVNALFTGVLVVLLQRYLDGRWSAFWLCPFLWLWANLHSGFLSGVILAGLAAAGMAVDAWRGTGTVAWPRIRRLAIAILASVALSVVNPFGIATLLFPLGTLTSPLIQGNIQEWASPDFHTLPGQLLEAVILLMIVGLATGRVRARIHEWLWALAFLGLAFSSQRNVPLFILAGAPLYGRCAQAILQHAVAILDGLAATQPAERVAVQHAWLRPRATALSGLINIALLVIVGAGMVAYRALPNLTPSGEAAAIAASLPVGTTVALAAEPRPLRVFNYYDYGGYLVWNLFERGDRVFIDGRVEVYGAGVFRRYLAVNGLAPGWPQVLRQSGAQAVLMPTAHPLTALLAGDPSWHRVASDQVATLFVSAAVHQ
jgi:hypothetical protein